MTQQMKKNQLLGIFLMALSPVLWAQDRILTHTDFSAHTLVKDIFASGVCDNIDVISMIGHEDGVGFFENGSASIGIESGIILSTGLTQNAHGPNDVTDKSTNLPGPNDDVDLDRLASGEVHDPVGIEFDFVPLDTFVQFRYVFASEEYCEFVGSNYNDVFGFFVSGPGIDGPFANDAINVALVPGTSDYVAINSVNFNDNPAYYIHNEIAPDQEQCNLPVVSNPSRDAIQYDGFTQVLTARLELIPCQTYHIRLVVGDVSDPFFDSAVFLEAGSFDLGPEISVEAVSDEVFEGCEDTAFRFTRITEASLDRPFTVQFHTAGTATSGQDYEILPQEVTIPAGEAYYDLPVNTLYDNLAEPDELLRVVLDIPCACYSDSADLRIVAPPLLEAELDNIYVCPDEESTVGPEVSGGIGSLSYVWSNGAETPEITVSASGEQTYSVVVSDQCGQEVEVSANLLLRDPPLASISGTAQICAGESALFPLNLEGTPPFALTFERDGEPYVINLGELTDQLSLSQAGQYELLGVTDAACAGEGSGTARLEVWEILAEAEVTDLKCYGESEGEITVSLSQGTPPYQLNWQHSGGTENPLLNIPAGFYELRVRDANNCVADFAWEVESPGPISLPAPDCNDLFANTLTVDAQGGTPPYLYQPYGENTWSATAWWRSMIPGEEYQVVVRDANNCEAPLTWLMPPIYSEGMAWLPDQVKMPLGVTEPLEWESYVPENLLAELSWQPADQLSCTDCLTPDITAISATEIILTIEDLFGCKQRLISELIIDNSVDIYLPNAFSPNGDDQNDSWRIYGNELQIEHIKQLLIFDRWGNLLFQADDWPINSERHGWDGYFRGQPLDTGVYIFSVEVQLVNGEAQTFGGDILLIR